ncbi:MAG: type II secretion system F family protein [Chloroflexota bacterium]
MDLISIALPITILIIGTGIIGLGIGAVLAWRASSPVDQRLDRFIESPESGTAASQEVSASALTRFRRQFNNVSAVLNSDEMQRKLIAANWSITVSEYWFIRMGAALLAFMGGALVFRSILPAAGVAVTIYLVPGFLLFRGIQARQRLFQAQLIDALTLIRGAVAAGYSFQQALSVVIQEMSPPTSDEFRHVRREVELGMPLSRALENMAGRMESDDFNLVVTVVLTNLQLGGNLTTILNVVMETIRARIALFSEIRALTAYAHFASYLLTLLPFVTVVILAVMSPVYWRQLFEPGATRFVLIYAICSLVVGNVLLRRIGRVRV